MGRTVNNRPQLVSTPSSGAIATNYFHQNEWKGICEDKNTFGVDQNTFAECENVYVNRDNFLCNRPGLNKINEVLANGDKVYSTKSYIIYLGTDSKIIDVKQSILAVHTLTLPENFNESELYFYEIGNILFAFGNDGIYKLNLETYSLVDAMENLLIPDVVDAKNMFIPNAKQINVKDITPDKYESEVLPNASLYENPLLKLVKQNTNEQIDFPYPVTDLKYILLYNTSFSYTLSPMNRNTTIIVSEGYPYIVSYTSEFNESSLETSLNVTFTSLNTTLYPSKTFSYNAIHLLFPAISGHYNFRSRALSFVDFDKFNGNLYFVFNGSGVNTTPSSQHAGCIVKCDASSIHSASTSSNIFSAVDYMIDGSINILFDDSNNQISLYRIKGHQSNGSVWVVDTQFYRTLDAEIADLRSSWYEAITYSDRNFIQLYLVNSLTLYKVYFSIFTTTRRYYVIANSDGYISLWSTILTNTYRYFYFYKNNVYLINGSNEKTLCKDTLTEDFTGNTVKRYWLTSLATHERVKTGAFCEQSNSSSTGINKAFSVGDKLYTRQFIYDNIYYPTVSPVSASNVYDIFVENSNIWFFTDNGVFIYSTNPSSVNNNMIYYNGNDDEAKYTLKYIVNGEYSFYEPTLIRPIGSNSFLYFVNDTSYILQVRYNDENLKLYIPEGKENKYYDTVIDAEQTSDRSLAVIGNNVIYSVVDTGEIDDKLLPIFQYIQSKLNLRVIEDSDSIIAYNSSTLLMPTYNGIAAVNYSQLISVEEQTVNYITDNILSHWFRFIATETGRLKTCNHNYYLLVYHTNRNDLYMFDYRSNTWWYWTFDKNIKLLHTIGLYCFIVFEDNTLHYFDEKVLDAQWSVTSQKLFLGNNTNYKQIRRFTVHTVGEHSEFPSKELADNIVDLRFYCYRKRMHSIQELEDRDDVYNFNVDFVRTYVIRLNYPKVYEFQYRLSSNSQTLRPLNLTGITIEYKVGGKVR